MGNRPRYKLEIHARINDQAQGGHLSIDEEVEVEADGFLELAGILGQFHELAKRLTGQMGGK